MTFQQSTGADGLRLVPDLAVSIPTPTDGGRTYAFQIRPGIRYSDGQPLLRRRFSSRGRAAVPRRLPGHFGVRRPRRRQRVHARPVGCDLSQGIVTNDAAGTVTFHFTEPDPEFLYQLTEFAFSAPIPPGTPDQEPGQRTVPGTGPYKIVSVSPDRDPVRAQPVLPRVVTRRPTGRQPQRDRVATAPRACRPP